MLAKKRFYGLPNCQIERLYSKLCLLFPVVTPMIEPPADVPEDDGPVEVCITLPSGQTERDVVVELLVEGITATGNEY